MEPSRLIRERRVQLGLTEAYVSSTAGLSRNEYFALELNPSEAFEVVTLGALRAVCQTLGLDLLELVGEKCTFCERGETYSEDFGLPRDKLIARRREERGVSFADLADRLGFYETALIELEKREDFLDGWSIDLVRRLARELDLPLHILLACRCRRCGQ